MTLPKVTAVGLLAAPIMLLVWLVGLIGELILSPFHSDTAKERKAKKRAQEAYEAIYATHQQLPFQEFVERVRYYLPAPPPEYLTETVVHVCADIHAQIATDSIPKPPALCNTIEGAKYLDRLAEIGTRSSEDMEASARVLAEFLVVFIQAMPHTNAGEFMVDVPQPPSLIDRLIMTLYKEQNRHTFTGIRAQLNRNLEEQGTVFPPEYQGEDAAHAYLKGTPFLQLFSVHVPISIPDQTWFEHAHIVAPSGGGKTQLLSQLFLKLYDKGAMVCVDSQGDWIGKLRRLKAIQNRVLYIDPRDPPTVNLFRVDIFDYLFSVKGTELTAKQRVFFSYLTKLMRQVPNATMMDVLKALNDIGPYMQYADRLPEAAQLFFQNDYDTKTFAQTKEEVRYRINALIEHPTMERLFTSSEQAIDIGRELDRGTVILIDTSLDYLKGASAPFGKIFIALMLQAVQERAATPEHDRKPAYFLCDEASAYFDKNITDLLEMARKYKLSCVFAHQQLSQCTPELRSSLMSNTSIKLATQNAVDDAKVLAPNMRTEPDFILAQPKLTFAAYIRGVTENAVAITITPGLLEKEPMVERHEPPRKAARDETVVYEVQPSPPHDTTDKPQEHEVIYLPPPDDTKPSTW